MSQDRKYLFLSTIFISSIIASNIIAVKIIEINGNLVPCGILIFPFSYIIGDILVEVYGLQKAKDTIIAGFLGNIIVVFFVFIALKIQPASLWEEQSSFESILSQTPRILLASLMGYVTGSLANAKIMSLVKSWTKKKFLWLRTISSTVIGEGIDTLVFLVIGFYGIYSNNILFDMIVFQYVFKVAYEVIITPLTCLTIRYFQNSQDRKA